MTERASIAAWLEKHRDSILRWVSWKTHKLDRFEREDVAQQVALELLNRDDEVHNPEGLAKQIVSFRVIDAIRNKENAPPSINEYEDDAEIGARSHNGHPPSTIAEHDIDVWRAVGKLPEPGRTILWLRIVEEDTFAIIASKLRIPEANARYHFGKAVTRLTRALHYVGISGLVTDDGEAPQPGAQVTARGIVMRDYRKMQTDHHGQFAMASLHAGRYSLRTVKTGYAIDERSLDVIKPMQSCTIALRKAEVGEKLGVGNAGS